MIKRGCLRRGVGMGAVPYHFGFCCGVRAQVPAEATTERPTIGSWPAVGSARGRAPSALGRDADGLRGSSSPVSNRGHVLPHPSKRRASSEPESYARMARDDSVAHLMTPASGFGSSCEMTYFARVSRRGGAGLGQ